MKNYLGRLVLLVKDYEEALSFYTAIFGFEILYDQINTENNTRYLHIGYKENKTCGLWLLKAESEAELSVVGKQTAGAPFLVLYTSNLPSMYHRLRDLNVTIRIGPIADSDYSFLHCLDLYGNEIIVVQSHEELGSVIP